MPGSSLLVFVALLLIPSFASISDCDLRWFEQSTDHFVFPSPSTYNQRVFVCSKMTMKPRAIFFYTGNESPVEVYLNNTGLMWENAAAFDAILVFAEHRYYGESQPLGNSTDRLKYLSVAQAMADYANLIAMFRDEYKVDKVIVFGGSYGGMLSAWMRIKYPHLVTGAIASSAPLLFSSALRPPPNEYAFYSRVTQAMGDRCSHAFRNGSAQIAILAKTAQGRSTLSTIFKTCKSLESEEEALKLINWFQDPWTSFAMGNYPFPSSYIISALTPGREGGILPAWPLRKACAHLEICNTESTDSVLSAMRDAAFMWFNNTGNLPCVTADSSDDDGLWGFQFCAEMTFAFSSGGSLDVFSSSKFNLSETSERCSKQWGVRPDPLRAIQDFGDFSTFTSSGVSSIFFANGDQDPWTDYSLSDCGDSRDCSSGISTWMIENGGHHADLMFSTLDDPTSLTLCREAQVNAMRKWLGLEIQSLFIA